MPGLSGQPGQHESQSDASASSLGTLDSSMDMQMYDDSEGSGEPPPWGTEHSSE